MALNPVRIRQLHRRLVPFMVAPLLITLITGSLYQFASLGGQAGNFIWLLDIHRGKFGPLNLSVIYPFLNALGLLTFIITGSLMWWNSPARRKAKKSAS